MVRCPHGTGRHLRANLYFSKRRSVEAAAKPGESARAAMALWCAMKRRKVFGGSVDVFYIRERQT
jgi:hypothetical protein